MSYAVRSNERPLFAIFEGSISPGSCRLAFDGGEPPARRLSLHELDATTNGAERCRTVQGKAALLVRQIRSVQPQGPYRLAGWSIAGVLAYEVACQLAGADEEVEFLGLVDSDCSSVADRRAQRQALDCVESANSLRRAALEYEAQPAPLALSLFSSAPGAAAGAHRGWRSIARQVHVHSPALTELELVAQLTESLNALPSSPASADGARQRGDQPAHSPLITIQRGGRSAFPVFCVPGAGAGIADFLHLVNGWGHDVPAHGLHHRGMDGVLLPYSTVETAAAVSLREVNRVAPRGGVHLVGHSFGGWIALEMALRLQATGRDVSLTLLDSDFPGGTGRVGREYTRAEALEELVTLYEAAAERPLGVTRADLEARDAEGQLVHLHSALVRIGLLPKQSGPSLLRGPVRAFEAAIRTHYRPERVFAGPVGLVLVPLIGESEASYEERSARTLAGWKNVAPQLVYRRATGNHVSMLKPPHAAGLADWVRTTMQALESGTLVPRAFSPPIKGVADAAM
jgi:arthrofactin-type cyclic lipopeptide synthetase C